MHLEVLTSDTQLQIASQLCMNSKQNFVCLTHTLHKVLSQQSMDQEINPQFVVQNTDCQLLCAGQSMDFANPYFAHNKSYSHVQLQLYRYIPRVKLRITYVCTQQLSHEPIYVRVVFMIDACNSAIDLSWYEIYIEYKQ